VGGSVVLAVPPAFLDQLHLQAGASVGLIVTDGRMVVEPKPRPHYTLSDLLAAFDYSQPLPPEERKWVDAPVSGAELICITGIYIRFHLTPSQGHEQRRSRPVLIVSPGDFTLCNQITCDLSDYQRRRFCRRIGFAVPISGIKITGFVRCDQPRVLDMTARNVRKVDVLPTARMDEGRFLSELELVWQRMG